MSKYNHVFQVRWLARAQASVDYQVKGNLVFALNVSETSNIHLGKNWELKNVGISMEQTK